jgi:type IV pilus assembly protein PilF|tara:strand:+ start:218 stop:964 length:747 start_codon:yes stop_codon:yes gene_type:complete
MHIKAGLLVLLLPILTACVTVGGEPMDQNEKASAINVQLGLGYMSQNNLGQANIKLLRAIDKDPESASAHNAYAMLQERLLEKGTAQKHYKIATELDPENSEASNNYGAFLCNNGRQAESEKYFLRALKNPLYKTPAYAYTNAARCLLMIEEKEKAKSYLRKALVIKSNFGNALIEMATIELDDGDFAAAKNYIDRFHLVDRPTARSLWLAIRIELGINELNNVKALGHQLELEFPNSAELKSWLALQ